MGWPLADARKLAHTWLVSGLPGVAETLMDEGQTYSERLLTLDLGLLDREGTEEALAVPFEQDAGLRVETEAIAAIHADSGGYPWFVRLWGAHVWNTLQRHGPVDRAAVEIARARVEADTDGFYARRWARVPDGRARDLVRALAAREGRGAVGELVADIGLQRSEQIGPARADLLGRGLVFAPSRGRLAFTVPGFDRWVLARA